MDKKIPKEKKGFNMLSENLQKQISPKLAAEYNMGGMVEDKRLPFRGGGIAYAGGGKAMKRGKK